MVRAPLHDVVEQEQALVALALVEGHLDGVGGEGGGEDMGRGEFVPKYFLEVNARVQVEHPVTEMVTGVDIVKGADTDRLGTSPSALSKEEVRTDGSAIECRINAEDPLNDFVPSPGKLKSLSFSGRNCHSGGQRRVYQLHDTTFLRPNDIEAHRVGEGPE